MNRIQLACYALLASTFILATLFVSSVFFRAAAPANGDQPRQVASLFENEAVGAMVINRGLVNVLTAQGVGSDDFIYVLDNKNERLFAYAPDQRGNIKTDLIAALDVKKVMDAYMQKYGQADAGDNRRPGR